MDQPPLGGIPPLENSTRPGQPSRRVWSGRRVWLWLLLVVLAVGLIAVVWSDQKSMCGCIRFNSTVPPTTLSG
jgi:hypothetical protein